MTILANLLITFHVFSQGTFFRLIFTATLVQSQVNIGCDSDTTQRVVIAANRPDKCGGVYHYRQCDVSLVVCPLDLFSARVAGVKRKFITIGIGGQGIGNWN